MGYDDGDWVVDKFSGAVGTVVKKHWTAVLVRFNGVVVYRYPDLLEAAPLDIQQEDIQDMIELALLTGDKEWFMELTERMNFYRSVA
jgi:hypothetical protein